MTAALTQQTVPVKDAAGVRKRRRRAPAGGAADDCFACAKKGIKCDRKRPYCSQCLEVGSECSGYKTQLTWGVGVASRGKLRGLSLPIAKSPPVARDPPVRRKTPTSRSRSSSNVTSQWSEPGDMRRTPRGPIDIPVVTQAASAPTTPYQMIGYDYLSVQPDQTPPFTQGGWTNVGYSPIMHSPDVNKYNKFGLPLVTEGLSSSVESLSEVDYMSPMSQSYQRDDFSSYANSPQMIYDNYSAGHASPGPHSPPSLYMDPSSTVPPTSCPSLVYAPSEACSSIHSSMDAFDTQFNQKLMRDCDALTDSYTAVYGPCSF